MKLSEQIARCGEGQLDKELAEAARRLEAELESAKAAVEALRDIVQESPHLTAKYPAQMKAARVIIYGA